MPDPIPFFDEVAFTRIFDTDRSPAERIPLMEFLDYLRHFIPGEDVHAHNSGGCGPCDRFGQVLVRCGAVVVNYDTGVMSLHPSMTQLLGQPGQLAGLAEQPAGRAGSPYPRPTPDILDTVADDGRLRCACGCRVVITNDSPSAYYASQECQSRYLESQATEPGEVYSGVDAHISLMLEQRPEFEGRHERPEQRRVPSSEIDRCPAVGWLGELSARVAERAVIQPFGDGQVAVSLPPPSPHRYSMLDYRRLCPRCAAVTPPRTLFGPVDAGVHVTLRGNVELPAVPGPVRQVCGACRTELPGRIYFGTLGSNTLLAQDGRPSVILRPSLFFLLEDGLSQTSTVVNGLTPESSDEAARVWRGLEKRLDRFACQWQPDNQSSQPSPAGLPYMIDVPSPPRWRGRRT